MAPGGRISERQIYHAVRKGGARRAAHIRGRESEVAGQTCVLSKFVSSAFPALIDIEMILILADPSPDAWAINNILDNPF